MIVKYLHVHAEELMVSMLKNVIKGMRKWPPPLSDKKKVNAWWTKRSLYSERIIPNYSYYDVTANKRLILESQQYVKLNTILSQADQFK